LAYAAAEADDLALSSGSVGAETGIATSGPTGGGVPEVIKRTAS
jgi:hypothetical protein